jgi:hypothetical protein
MRPARFLLTTSISILLMVAVALVIQSLPLWQRDGESFGQMLWGDVAKNPWLNGLFQVLRTQSTQFMYLGVLGLILWMIWRDEHAEWTVAASSSIKLAATLIGAGTLVAYLYASIMFGQDMADLSQGLMRQTFVSRACQHVVFFGMALWLHALASNQIPKLMDMAVVRRKENLGAGLILFFIGFLLMLIPFGAQQYLPRGDTTGIAIATWLYGSIGLPLLLLSYSLFSMGYLAKREIEARALAEGTPSS